jgi:hypothetical protein
MVKFLLHKTGGAARFVTQFHFLPEKPAEKKHHKPPTALLRHHTILRSNTSVAEKS